mmetsp:Transcript_43316/g.116446  ORF Transcript_43316/g.116446 Transcript_43316/m.116446 type:complete len:313 (-) Transcript_43316:165-1103(-)
MSSRREEGGGGGRGGRVGPARSKEGPPLAAHGHGEGREARRSLPCCGRLAGLWRQRPGASGGHLPSSGGVGRPRVVEVVKAAPEQRLRPAEALGRGLLVDRPVAAAAARVAVARGRVDGLHATAHDVVGNLVLVRLRIQPRPVEAVAATHEVAEAGPGIAVGDAVTIRVHNEDEVQWHDCQAPNDKGVHDAEYAACHCGGHAVEEHRDALAGAGEDEILDHESHHDDVARYCVIPVDTHNRLRLENGAPESGHTEEDAAQRPSGQHHGQRQVVLVPDREIRRLADDIVENREEHGDVDCEVREGDHLHPHVQ